MPPVFLNTKKEYEALIDKFDTFMFDCDGVIWHGDRLVPGAREVLTILRERSKYIVTTQPRVNHKKLKVIHRETRNFCHKQLHHV